MFLATNKNISPTINLKQIKNDLFKSTRRKIYIQYNSCSDPGKENIEKIVSSLKSHYTTCFKESLIIMDYNDFLKRFYIKNEPRKYLRKIANFYNQFQILFPILKPSSVNKQIYINAANKDYIINEMPYDELNTNLDQELKEKPDKYSCFKRFFNEEDYYHINNDNQIDMNVDDGRKNKKEGESIYFPNNSPVDIPNNEDSIISVEEIINTIDYAENVANENKKGLSTPRKPNLGFIKKAEEFLKKIEQKECNTQIDNNNNIITSDINSFYYPPEENYPSVSYNEYNKNILNLYNEKTSLIKKIDNKTTNDYPKNISKEVSKLDLAVSNVEIKDFIQTEITENIKIVKRKENNRAKITKSSNLRIFHPQRNISPIINKSKSPIDIYNNSFLIKKYTISKNVLTTKENQDKKSLNSKVRQSLDLNSINTKKLDLNGSKFIANFISKFEKKEDSIDLNKLLNSKYNLEKKLEGTSPKENKIKYKKSIKSVNERLNITMKKKSKKEEIKSIGTVSSSNNIPKKNKPKSFVPIFKKDYLKIQTSKKLN